MFRADLNDPSADMQVLHVRDQQSTAHEGAIDELKFESDCLADNQRRFRYDLLTFFRQIVNLADGCVAQPAKKAFAVDADAEELALLVHRELIPARSLGRRRENCLHRSATSIAARRGKGSALNNMMVSNNDMVGLLGD